MFAKHKVTAVNSTGIKTTKMGGTSVTANLQGVGSANLSMSTYTNSQYSYYMSGLLPATPDLPDTTPLTFFYRDMYLHDSVAGSCVDIQSVFPFSDWELRGLEEKELSIFNTALERLNLRELLPQASVSYLTDGFYTGSLIYDAKDKNFMDILTHDALNCALTASPFNNIDPTVRVTVAGAVTQFLEGSSEYAKRYLNSMPGRFVDLLKQGSFVLEPLTTIFLARRGLTDRPYQSYLHRILPMYLIEKAMYRGTLIEANRRQRAMSHISSGDDLWTPTSEELMTIVQQFQAAEQDPLGGWISTRNAVQVTDLRPGGDFWKWTEMTDTMVQYKLRALGISEALLSGDASYASAESAYSTFLETVNAYRTHLTHNIFNKKLFPLIAVANGLYKDKSKKSGTDDLMGFLYNTANRNNLHAPILHWNKDLTAKTEDNMMDMLEKVKEQTGMPIPLKTWLAAAGVDKDTLVRDAREDDELRESLNMGREDPDPEDDGGGDIEAGALPSVSMNAGYRKRTALLNRHHGEELFATTPTGKRKHVLNQEGKMKDIHHRIAKIAARADSDPNYREQLKKNNIAKNGTATLKGVF
jgi:hypothetical protein